MLNRLRRLWHGDVPGGNDSMPPLRERVPLEMAWLADTQMPIPDWERIAAAEPADDLADRHAFWNSAAAEWLEALGQQLGDEHGLRHSPNFFLLSALPHGQAELFLAFCERVLRYIRGNLKTLADDGGWGRFVAIVFAHEDDYYDYIAHYYPEGGEYSMSSGMFIHAGYGHFALPEVGLESMEPTIAHELTHSLLAHLPIPAWLNEGLAVNTERTLFPLLAHPSAQLYFPREIAAQHAAYWNEDSIQTFWSGKSFLHTDDGNRLSYDLAKKITALAANDEAAFRKFVADAKMEDAGMGAEHHLGYPIAHLVEAVLGEGAWEPKPDSWREGIERGQFRESSRFISIPR